MTCVVFGSSMGNTENAANMIAANLGINDVINIAESDASTLNGYDKLIIGSSTWGSGDLQDDWDGFDFDALEVNGKVVALFGLGDGSSYSDTFCDAMGIIYEKLSAKGANIVGSVDKDGYDFDESLAVRDGKFVGLALDDDNESDQTQERIDSWTKAIKANFS